MLIIKLGKQINKMKHKQACGSQQEYFKSLLKNLQNHNQTIGFNQTSYPQTQEISAKCIEDAIDQIQFGIIAVKDEPDIIDQIIKIPLHRQIGEDIQSIDKKIIEGEQMLKEAKRQLLIHKKQQQEALRLQNQIKKRQNQEKIKLWYEQQKIFNQKRQQLFQKYQKQAQQQQQRQKEEKQAKRQESVSQRRLSVQQRLRNLQQSRQRRKQLFQQSQQETKRIKLPKFRIIEKQFQKIVAEKQFEKQILKKNMKLSFKLNHELIKQHEKNYMQKVYERMKAKGYSSQKNINDGEKLVNESRFNNLLQRNEDQTQKDKEKFKRRMGYQERLEQINVNVDENKKIKILIEKDKAKNPFKYNFLGQKQLNDHQIYMEFKDFNLDIDRNQLGNNYLEESKKIGFQSRIKKSHSVSAISLKNREQQFKYRDYLLQMRSHVSSHNISGNPNSKQSMQEVFKKQSNRQNAINKISMSLKKYDDEISDKRNQLKNFNTFSTTLKKSKQIDQMYMKSLKAKLACLEIQQGK